MQKIQKIDQWYDNGWLGDTFTRSCGTFSQGVMTSFFFTNIYAPVAKRNPTKHAPIPNEWTWEQFGFTPEEIADAYWAEFGGNYFNEFYKDNSAWATALASDKVKTVKMIRAILQKNKLKYKKLIDLAGYAYDPLNNVDAHEMFSVFENHGGQTSVSAGANSSAVSIDNNNQHSVSTYDSDPKEEYTDETNGTGTTKTPTLGIPKTQENIEGEEITNPNSVSSGVATNQVETSHQEASNMSGDYGEGRQQHAYHVNATDNAFGQELWGADYYKAEKHRRYGNIGTTKTTELLEAERENLKFILLDEFFRDINEVILVGVF